MSGRKRKVKHFVPKKSRDADYDQDHPTQHDIDFRQDSSHFFFGCPSIVRDFIAEFSWSLRPAPMFRQVLGDMASRKNTSFKAIICANPWI
jgi:hypothetical protein